MNLLVLLQVLIMLTGNFGFFNLLTLGLCLSVLPDTTWGFQINWVQPATLPTPVTIVLTMLLLPATIFWIYKSLFEKSKRLDFLLPFMRFFYPFRISNPYGLFAIMTKNRPELILEGSNDGEHWEEYVFSHKPTSVNGFPPIVSPHLPRLDWQMWFAGLESFNENLWLQNMMTRIFHESRDVLLLFEKDPFKGKAPKSLRILRYEYKFSSFTELRKEGRWWSRELRDSYSPVLHKEDFCEDAQ